MDFSGLWRPTDDFLMSDISLGLPKGETVPLKPSAAKIKEARLSKDDPEANCLQVFRAFPWRIVETPTHMCFVFEGNIHRYRQILDGRPHPPTQIQPGTGIPPAAAKATPW